MASIALVGRTLVGGGAGATGTGLITGPGAISLYGDALVISIDGDTVAPHGPGAHTSATLISGSFDTFANSKPVVRIGDSASCGCTVLDDGDTDAFCI